MNARPNLMNVNKVEHQRNIMALMGIDLWVPKTAVPTRVYNNTSLYRDQDKSEIGSLNFESLTESSSQSTKNEILKHQLNQVVEPELRLLNQPEEKMQVESIQPRSTLKKLESINTQPEVKIEAFELQALSFERCVVVINSTSMSVEQAVLWRNIQASVDGKFFELKWPFALTALQDARGVSVYVKGFLDAISVEKNIITLGSLEHYQNDLFLQTASLQDMLDQPITKRKLWKLMQQ